MSFAVRFLGVPTIERDGVVLAPPRGRKAWALMLYLVLCERPPPRSRLASLLFADADDPLGALRWSLAELRRVLDDPLTLRGDPPAFRLPEGAVVDVLALSRPESGQASVVGWQGELLEGMSFPGCPAFETWLSYQRRYIAGVCEALMGEAALERLAAGDATGASELAAHLVSLDPLELRWQELLIRCLACSSDRVGAERQLAACEELFMRELGMRPGPELAAAAREGEDPAGGAGGDRVAALGQLDAGRAAVDAGAVQPGLDCLRLACAEAAACGDAGLRARSLVALGSALCTQCAVVTGRVRPRCTKRLPSPSRTASEPARRWRAGSWATSMCKPAGTRRAVVGSPGRASWRRRRRSAARSWGCGRAWGRRLSSGTAPACRTGLSGEEIPLSARVVVLARDVEVLHRVGGIERVRAAVRDRAGAAYNPTLADEFLRHPDQFLAIAATTSPWDEVLGREPEARPWVPEPRLDGALSAFADFVDLKSPFTAGHSRGVAALASDAAAGDAVSLRRAALVHDLGRASVPNGIWDKPGPLTDGEWERVRLHPYYTERIVARVQALKPLATLAGMHHERLDGSGYHRGSSRAELPGPARILAAADAYQAMTQPRPHRPAFSPDEAAEELQSLARSGQHDREAVEAVLTAAGHQLRRSRPTWPAELTDREVEVLRLICRGKTKKEVARHLTISPSTVDHHVRHIYQKAGVQTRAGATLFALEHDLLK